MKLAMCVVVAPHPRTLAVAATGHKGTARAVWGSSSEPLKTRPMCERSYLNSSIKPGVTFKSWELTKAIHP